MRLKLIRQLANKTVVAIIFAGISSVAMAQVTLEKLGDEFTGGKLRLNQSMFGSGVGGTADLKALYDQKKWEELVLDVISKRFVVDTYYFYIGVAAEELGFPDAASVYYDLAINTDKKCAEHQMFTDTCVGFKFPGDAIKRKSGLSGTVKGTTQIWNVSEGPKVTELVGLPASTIADLLKPTARSTSGRGKFESEEEYKKRMKGAILGYLIVTKLPTNDDQRCATSYDHSLGEYKISKCLAFSETIPVLTETIDGEPVRLSNMIDSRMIKKIITRSYYLSANLRN